MVTILSSSHKDFTAQLSSLLQQRVHASQNITPAVAEIIQTVREKGDDALLDYTARFDRHPLSASQLRIHPATVEEACHQCPKQLREALQLAAERIRHYHEKQRPQDVSYQDAQGNLLGWRWRAVPRVGLYVPGGQAAYPSSVLMNAIPAIVAGVQRLVMVVPAPEGQLNHAVLAAAHIAGIEEIYSIGGAQAIAALAYGTSTVPAVDKIVGPGNQWVAEAKRQLFGTVGIDMIAGPSEICVVADAANNPEWIAADLLSQAEHDAQAQSILIVDDENFAAQTQQQIENLLLRLPRAAIARQSWEQHGAIIHVEDVMQSAAVIDQIAPEHLELAVDEPEKLAASIQCAGAIFMGRHTPEAYGDYVAGPSHVLPTMATARFSSGLSVYDFLNKQSIIAATPEGFQKSGRAAHHLAKAEGLDAHALSLQLRLNDPPTE
jgi:histidinol dehydrogenase